MAASEDRQWLHKIKKHTDDEENSTAIFDSVHLSHSEEFCNDLMGQQLLLNVDKNEDLYLKMLKPVAYFAGNSEESTMMMKQGIWCESSRSYTTSRCVK